MYFCPKRPAFSKIFTDGGHISANCERITISSFICLKSKLQVKEKALSRFTKAVYIRRYFQNAARIFTLFLGVRLKRPFILKSDCYHQCTENCWSCFNCKL